MLKENSCSIHGSELKIHQQLVHEFVAFIKGQCLLLEKKINTEKRSISSGYRQKKDQ